MNKINLKEIQRKITTSYFEDGIWDLVIGLVFLNFGLSLIIDQVVFVGVGAAVVVTLVPLLKKWITLPRFGHIQILQREKRRFSMLGVLLLVIGLALALGLSSTLANTSLGEIFLSNALLLIGLIWGGTLVFVGYWLHYNRLYLYGPLIAFPFATQDWLIDFPLKMIIISALITLVSLIVMLRFIQKYPKIDLPEV